LILAIALVGAVLYVGSARPEREGAFVVPGLERPVDILWSERAVPHIRASSLEDAVRAQGYVHARDRLWQMELVRRAVEGRLAEV
ncbi:MAG: penicillin acylase family protein, partial [Gammaproteobacteria bacterium]|nr:penicillin acylase family protein [Gemmatimonadota bacterium]NIU77576.1 penicillin acylase family protein [Gammaproteobacteria bacterium]NIY11112.1 penicillin acylase family protein [Gemmatimonadota bacterium]